MIIIRCEPVECSPLVSSRSIERRLAVLTCRIRATVVTVLEFLEGVLLVLDAIHDLYPFALLPFTARPFT